MNRIYRLVWNEVQQAWVAVAETARGRGKQTSRKLIAVALALAAGQAFAAPVGGQVTAGSGSISQSGTTTTINQGSQNLSLSWQSFNTSASETVNFAQPSASAIAVNRIYDTNGTQFFGHLNANGQVYLINPNGILFGAGSQVNVGGLVASTLDISDASLGSAARSFSGSGTGSVVNRGTINGGYVAFIGNTVSNQGTIIADGGAAALGAGSAVTLTFAGNNLVKMQVDQGTLNNLADNGGLIRADGGLVLMSAGARNALLASVVNNTGVIEARTVQNHNGVITLLGGTSAGTVNVGGTLDASAPAASNPAGGNGGFIETSAAHVHVANDAKVTTLAANGLNGTWLIDPVDFTIAATGGDMTGAALGTALGAGSVVIQSTAGAAGTAGNVNVNDAVTWTANKLTLNAQNNININANLNGSGTASLALEYGQGALAAGNTSNYYLGNGAQVNLPVGNNFSTKLGSDGVAKTFTVINSVAGLQGINNNLAGNYALGGDVNGTGGIITPIGMGSAFTGNFDGLGHIISGLTIAPPGYPTVPIQFTPPLPYAGLFYLTAAGSSISNVGLVASYVAGGNNNMFIGLLAGANGGTIRNSYTTGTVIGGSSSITASVGGLVGANWGGTIDNCHADVWLNVTGSATTKAIGGLAGVNTGTISNSYTSGHNITASATPWGDYVGGLVGQNNGTGTISNSYSTANVYGAAMVGGLVGQNWGGKIDRSYATGNVTGGNANVSVAGTSAIGGLVGQNNRNGIISNSHETGNVMGDQLVGGLVGQNSDGTIVNSYATGNVTGITNMIGGLVGQNSQSVNSTGSIISGSYATGNVSGGSDVGGLVGHNNVATIDNSYAWGNVAATGYYSGGLVGYNAPWSTVNNSYSIGKVTGSTAYGGLVGANYYGTVTNSFWDVTTSGQVSSAGGTGMTTAQMQQQANFTTATGANGNVNPNWDFANTWYIYNGLTYPLLRATLTPITVTANNATKTYDGLAYSGGNGVNYSVANATLSGTLTYGGTSQGAVNAGSYSITPGGLYSTTYLINYANGTLTIDPLALTVLTVSGTVANNKVYDGTTTATLTNGILNGVLAGDVVTLNQAGTFATKNAGVHIPVTAADTLGGASAGNYTLTQPTGLFADITPAPLLITGLTANNKVYDGTALATLSGLAAVTPLGTDIVNLGGTGSGAFANKNVGIGKTVTVSGYTLSGTDAGNYTLMQPTGLTANITPASLSVSGTLANNKVYDGTTAATLTNGTLNGLIAGDVVTLNQAGNFATKNVGTGIAVTAADTLGGLDAGNYTLVQPAGLAANITPASLSVSGTLVAGKVYDGTTTATLTNGLLNGVIAGDIVTLNQAGNFATKNVGTNIPVTAADTLGGLDAGNYTLAQPTGLSGNITARPVNLTGTRAYDGSTVVSSNIFTMSNLVAGETLTLTGAGSIPSKNVGSYPVTLGSLTLGNGSGLASNYTFTGGTQAATITQLGSVMWIGPAAGGLWANPANWAGGAIPDLANVANVIIPSGSNVIFNSSVAGPVMLNQLTGGGLTMNSGTLNIANTFNMLNYGQTGGLVSGAGNFTVTNSFTQTGGQIAMGGNVSITQAAGPLAFTSISANNASLTSSTGGIVLGNLSTTGNLTATALGGTITQAAATKIGIGGTTALAASSGGLPAGITINNAGNTFGQAVSANGSTVGITAAGPLTLGTVTTTGALTANSAGALNLGTATVGGNLIANSGNGNVSQAGPLLVTGTTRVTAGTGSIALTNTGNKFARAVSATGNNVAVTAAGALTLGRVTATGNLTANSTGALNLGTSTVGGNLAVNSGNGNVRQGGPLKVSGTTNIVAGRGNVSLTNTRNSFGNAVSASGNNVSLTAGGPLTLGTVTTTRNLTVNSKGALNLGTSTVGRDLSVNSGNGNVTQGGPLKVQRNTSINAGRGSIVLTDPGNALLGKITAIGSTVNIVP